MKILNLYAGIGGNRKLWGRVHEITAVEIDKDIAAIYKDFYPNDNVIVGDAHQYLLDNYEDYDFIWSSPPCTSHSRMNFLLKIKGNSIKYPDMKLYEEILLLKIYCKSKWVIENVMSSYKPLIVPQIAGRHYFWSNFLITNIDIREKVRNDKGMVLNKKMIDRGIIVKNFHNYKHDKRTLLNNCVEPELGLHIFNRAFDIIENEKKHKQISFFN